MDELDILFPELTLDMILNNYINDKYQPQEVIKILLDEEYTDLGWINDYHSEASKLNRCDLLNGFREVYKNWSGSYTILVDDFRRFYCIDMGD